MSLLKHRSGQRFQIYSIAIILLLFLLPSCRSARRIVDSKQIKLDVYEQKNLEQYSLKIEGIECASCAQRALAVVEKIGGVTSAYYRAPKLDISAGCVVCFAERTVFVRAISELTNALSEQNFALQQLEGVLPYDDKWQPVRLKFDIDTQSTIIEVIAHEQTI